MHTYKLIDAHYIHYIQDELMLAYSTASESQDTTSVTSGSRTTDQVPAASSPYHKEQFSTSSPYNTLEQAPAASSGSPYGGGARDQGATQASAASPYRDQESVRSSSAGYSAVSATSEAGRGGPRPETSQPVQLRPGPRSYSSEDLILPAGEDMVGGGSSDSCSGTAKGSALAVPDPFLVPSSSHHSAASSYQSQNYQINSIRRFSTEVDIHHATPLLLEPEPEPPLYEDELQPSYLQTSASNATSTSSASMTSVGFNANSGNNGIPPYRAPPPHHLYHPRGRMGPLLPPVDEDDYVEDKVEEDLHRQLLNLPLHANAGSGDSGMPLHSDGGSHDSHNDSGYSTRVGASAGPSPSLSGSTTMSIHISIFIYYLLQHFSTANSLAYTKKRFEANANL